MMTAALLVAVLTGQVSTCSPGKVCSVGQLRVSGAATIAGALALDGGLDVRGEVLIRSAGSATALTARGGAYFDGGVKASWLEGKQRTSGRQLCLDSSNATWLWDTATSGITMTWSTSAAAFSCQGYTATANASRVFSASVNSAGISVPRLALDPLAFSAFSTALAGQVVQETASGSLYVADGARWRRLGEAPDPVLEKGRCVTFFPTYDSAACWLSSSAHIIVDCSTSTLTKSNGAEMRVQLQADTPTLADQGLAYGVVSGVAGNGDAVYSLPHTAQLPRFTAQLKTPSSLTGAGIVAGMALGSDVSEGTYATQNGMFFRYNPVLADGGADTAWQLMTCNGTGTCTATTTGVTVATSTEYAVIVDYDGTTVRGTVNGTTVATTSSLPTGGSQVPIVNVENRTAALAGGVLLGRWGVCSK